MSSVLYKKERQSPVFGGCLFFSPSLRIRTKVRRTEYLAQRRPAEKGQLFRTKNAAPREKSVDIQGKIWYDIIGEI